MDVSESSLPGTINPNNFPAKLWRLVNNPTNRAICWDSQGEVIIIDQQLFERQVLSPRCITEDNTDAFKTTNFSSFVRQLNLYGFKKVDPHTVIDGAGERGTFHHFYNPNFKRNHPELVANLRRLTVDNKAKIQAGLHVNCRPPSRHQRPSGDKNMQRGSSLQYSSMHQESPHPYYPNRVQAMKAHVGTPVPPRYLIRGHGGALSPVVFASDKEMPVPLSHCCTGVPSNSSNVQMQQPLLSPANLGSPNCCSFNPCNTPYQPRYCSPVFHYYHPNLMPSHMSGGYYQAGYSVNELSHGDQDQNLKNNENQEGKKCDVHLDTIFQIANEVMQTPLNNCLIKVETPEKPDPVLELPSSASNASGLWAGSIVVAVSGSSPLVTYEDQESVALVPEQMPEDAICEVTSDDADDSEVIHVEISDIVYDGSQDQSSSCTENTPDL